MTVECLHPNPKGEHPRWRPSFGTACRRHQTPIAGFGPAPAQHATATCYARAARAGTACRDLPAENLQRPQGGTERSRTSQPERVTKLLTLALVPSDGDFWIKPVNAVSQDYGAVHVWFNGQ